MARWATNQTKSSYKNEEGRSSRNTTRELMFLSRPAETLPEMLIIIINIIIIVIDRLVGLVVSMSDY